jgi:spore coat protein CotH
MRTLSDRARGVRGVVVALVAVAGLAAGVMAQPDAPPREGDAPRPMRGPGGPGGGPNGGPGGQERKLLKRFDADKSGQLDAKERAEAREFLKANPIRRPGPGGGPGGPGPGGPGMFGNEKREPAKPGERVAVEDVKPVTSAGLYDTSVVRTFFLEFESPDWEAELSDFYNTDVEVPAMLTLDGKRYAGVGVAFRGASSFFAVPAGYKRSFNISADFTDSEQRVMGKKTLNLLNAHSDPSMMSTVLYSQLANEHIPAPRAAFSRVVINGESWGVYVNTEQFDSVFVNERFEKSADAKGARWKVKGTPNGSSGLDDLGDDHAAYKAKYQIKSKDREEDWEDLANLCRVLSNTPLDELEAKLRPILDIEGVLWFLALDNVLVNMDGYWVRASDYSIYKDSKGVFHLIPHDMNEAFSGGGGPGGPGGRRPRGDGPERERRDRAMEGGDQQPPREREPRRLQLRGGVDLDPLAGMDDLRKPLRSRLLQVPSLRAKYLKNVRVLAEKSLDWQTLGPRVAGLRALVEPYVKAETRRLTSLESFARATANEPPAAGTRSRSLRDFAEKRRAYLMGYKAPRGAPTPESPARPD